MSSGSPVTVVPPRHRRRPVDAQVAQEGSSTYSNMTAIDHEVQQRSLDAAQSWVKSFNDALRHAARIFSQHDVQSQDPFFSIEFLLELSGVMQEVVRDTAALGIAGGLRDTHRLKTGYEQFRHAQFKNLQLVIDDITQLDMHSDKGGALKLATISSTFIVELVQTFNDLLADNMCETESEGKQVESRALRMCQPSFVRRLSTWFRCLVECYCEQRAKLERFRVSLENAATAVKTVELTRESPPKDTCVAELEESLQTLREENTRMKEELAEARLKIDELQAENASLSTQITVNKAEAERSLAEERVKTANLTVKLESLRKVQGELTAKLTGFEKEASNHTSKSTLGQSDSSSSIRLVIPRLKRPLDQPHDKRSTTASPTREKQPEVQQASDTRPLLPSRMERIASLPSIAVDMSFSGKKPVSLTRDALTEIMGGNSARGPRVSIRNAGPMAQKFNIMWYICISLSKFAWVPAAPGQHGFMMIDDAPQENDVGPGALENSLGYSGALKKGDECHLFVGQGKGPPEEINYCGLYRVGDADDVSKTEWTTLADSAKTTIIDRIYRQKHREAKKGNRKTLNKEQIRDLLDKGELAVRCILLQCVQFDREFYKELVAANDRFETDGEPKEGLVESRTPSFKRRKLDQDLPSDGGRSPHNIDDMYA